MALRVAKMIDNIHYTRFDSPLGIVFIAGTTKGICIVKFSKISEVKFLSILKKRYCKNIIRNDKIFANARKCLINYFKGRMVNFRIQLDLSTGTRFQRKVWQNVKEIPYGELRTYKWIADAIGSTHASRAVGNAVGKNPVAPIIPCHRVICSDGTLGGYSSGITTKKRLLKLEGIYDNNFLKTS